MTAIAPPYTCPTCGEPYKRTETGTYSDEVTLGPGGELLVGAASTEMDDATEWRCTNGHFRPCVRSYDGKGIKCIEHQDIWAQNAPVCVTVTVTLVKEATA